MRKFLAVVRQEYRKIVYKWTFLVGTLLFPVIAASVAIVPALILSVKGDPTRIVIVDSSGRIGPRIRDNLSPEKIEKRAKDAAREALVDMTADQEKKLKRNVEQFGETFRFVDFDATGKSAVAIRDELTAMVAAGNLDAYLIVPDNFENPSAVYQYFSRKSGDMIVNQSLKDALDSAVRSQRLADAKISEERLSELSRKAEWQVVKINDKGGEEHDAGGFWAGFIIAFMIYLNLAIYGQSILSAVLEEKETRIAEILFSSARPFELMMGKLTGVALAALTQFAIWVLSAAVSALFFIPYLAASGVEVSLPAISPLAILLFLVFFVLGFFLYSSIFALIGSAVTTIQEGSQFSFIPIMLMMTGFYFSFAVVRDPNSSIAFWSSIAPFSAPMTMPVRIISEMPPMWQIMLSVVVNAAAIAGLVWIASRVYRIGMLMYGKRATIPEILRWIRQS